MFGVRSISMSFRPSGIGFSRHRFAHRGAGWAGEPPAIDRVGAARPDLGLMSRVVSNVVDVAGVLGDIAGRVFEITKNIIAGSVPSRPPRRLDAMFSQIGQSA